MSTEALLPLDANSADHMSVYEAALQRLELPKSSSQSRHRMVLGAGALYAGILPAKVQYRSRWLRKVALYCHVGQVAYK